MNMQKAVVIIPAYNEEKTVGHIVKGVAGVLPQAEIIVIDDGSDDTTSDVAAQAGATVIKLPYNAGYGIALQTGYIYAAGRRADYCLQLDADGQHTPDGLPAIYDELKKGGADVVIGARHFNRDGSGYRASLPRMLGIRFFAFLCSVVIKEKITDSTSGFIGFSRKTLDFLVSDYFPVDYPDADVIIMMNRIGYRIKEVFVVMTKGTGKSMHKGLNPCWYIFKMLLSIARAAIIPAAFYKLEVQSDSVPEK